MYEVYNITEAHTPQTRQTSFQIQYTRPVQGVEKEIPTTSRSHATCAPIFFVYYRIFKMLADAPLIIICKCICRHAFSYIRWSPVHLCVLGNFDVMNICTPQPAHYHTHLVPTVMSNDELSMYITTNF